MQVPTVPGDVHEALGLADISQNASYSRRLSELIPTLKGARLFAYHVFLSKDR